MNFAGAFASTNVAKTVGSGVINTAPLVTGRLLVAALLGAIAWNLITWYLGLPSSSTHALIGGLVGAAIATGANDPVQWSVIWHSVVVPAVRAR